MAANPCSGIVPLEVPPGVTPGGKFVVVIDQYGDTKILARPLNKSILVFDGDDIYFADGSDDFPINLTAIPWVGVSSVLNGILAPNGAGRLFFLVNETAAVKTLQSQGGQVFWGTPSAASSGGSVPETGSGVLGKIDDATPAAWMDGEGIIYVNGSGEPGSIANGAAGEFLHMLGGEPVWGPLPSGNIASGGSGTNLASVVASNTDASTVNVRVPVFSLTNGVEGEEITVANVNVSVDLTDPLGDGGLDVGAEEANKWYYIYIMSDGVTVTAMASLDGENPDLANTAMTHWGLASLFRNNGSSNIVPFLQRGRRFSTGSQVVADPFTSAITFGAIPVSVVLTTVVPPSVQSVSGVIGGSDASGATTMRMRVVASTIDGIGYQVSPCTQLATAMDGWQGGFHPFQDLIIADAAAPVIYTKSQIAEPKSRLAITGYSI